MTILPYTPNLSAHAWFFPLLSVFGKSHRSLINYTKPFIIFNKKKKKKPAMINMDSSKNSLGNIALVSILIASVLYLCTWSSASRSSPLLFSSRRSSNHWPSHSQSVSIHLCMLYSIVSYGFPSL
jgi:hypothetical protein